MRKMMNTIAFETKLKAMLVEALKPLNQRLSKYEERSQELVERVDQQTKNVNELGLLMAKDAKFRQHVESLSKDCLNLNHRVVAVESKQKDSVSFLRAEVEQARHQLDKQESEARIVSQFVDRLTFDLREHRVKLEGYKDENEARIQKRERETVAFKADVETKLSQFESWQIKFQDDMWGRGNAMLKISAEASKAIDKVESLESKMRDIDDKKGNAIEIANQNERFKRDLDALSAKVDAKIEEMDTTITTIGIALVPN